MTREKFTAYNGVALIAALIFALFPLFWLVSTAFKPWHELVGTRQSQVSESTSFESRSQQMEFSTVWLTSKPTLENFHDVFYPYVNQMGMEQPSSWHAFLASTVVAGVATLVSIITGLMAAIALARYRIGGDWLPIYILSFRMLPPMAIAIPFAAIAATIGLGSAPLVMLTAIYAAFTAPLSAWILKSYIEQVPRELEDAAMMDGMSRWQAHWRITVPLVRGGLVATVFFIFILNWTETPIALALAVGKYVTVPVQIIDKMSSPHVQVALALLAMLPPAAIGFAIHRHLGRALTFGAIKK